jgi:hypothetical protein
MPRNRKIFFFVIFFLGSLFFGACQPAKIADNSVGKNGNMPVNGINKDAEINESMENKNFYSHLPEGFEVPEEGTGRKLLKEYGAVFVAQGGAMPPKKVIFKDEADVETWQAGVVVSKETIGGIDIQLQTPAMNALKDAVKEAVQNGLKITPRGNDAARRSYADTEQLWESRVAPALKHWVENGKLSENEAARIRALAPFDQVPEIFRLEDQGIYFSKDLSKSIIYSVAPPGASQHLSMLALDVVEYDDSKLREILARHGWFQTVVSDLPHFTFLGASEAQLPSLGLKRSIEGARSFWIPAI